MLEATRDGPGAGADFELAWPLADAPGARPRISEMNGITITEMRPAAIAVVRGPMAGAALANNGLANGWALLVHGPDKALAVAMNAKQAAEAPTLVGCEFTDVSDARACVRIEGPNTVALLAAGCPLDLASLLPGACAASLIGTFHALLHRHSTDDCVDVFVASSYAEAFWDWLLEAASEFRARKQ